MVENILIAVIILICIGTLVRHFSRQAKGKGGCGCQSDKKNNPPLQKTPLDLRPPGNDNGENNHH